MFYYRTLGGGGHKDNQNHQKMQSSKKDVKAVRARRLFPSGSIVFVVAVGSGHHSVK